MFNMNFLIAYVYDYLFHMILFCCCTEFKIAIHNSVDFKRVLSNQLLCVIQPSLTATVNNCIAILLLFMVRYKTVEVDLRQFEKTDGIT